MRFGDVRHLLSVAFVAALWTLGGCGGRPTMYPVSGTVTFEDGVPVRMGNVEFRQQESGRIARGRLDQSGLFALGTFANEDGALPGKYQIIVVQTFLPDQRLTPNSHHHADDRAEHDEVLRFVDPKIASYATSTLMAEVEAQPSNDLQLIVTPATLRHDHK